MEQDEAVRGYRRGRSWHRVSRGLHRPAGDVSDLPAWRLLLPPGGRFTHLTGAALHGWWLPPLPDGLPVFAAIPEDHPRPRRPGLRVSRPRRLEEPVLRAGVPVDPAPEVLLACARDLGLLDLVVLADAALHHRSCTREELIAASEGRRRGAPRLHQAALLADGRSESAWETLLRRLHEVLDVPVHPQFVLHDGEGGFVARADLWLVGTTTLHEYDGGDHLTVSRQRRDLARSRRIGTTTWVRRGYTSREVLHQAVAILRDCDLALGRPHEPERVRAWHALLAESLFTPPGRQRLLDRLGAAPRATGHEQQFRGA